VVYVVNFDNNNGFAIISARRNIEPVLALIDKGSYSSDIEQNMNFQYALEYLIHYASYANKANREAPHPSINAVYVDTIFPHPKTEPIVKVAWNQHWPEGMFCPNKIAGCGPIAAAQILSALHLPNSMSYTYPEHDLSSENIDWTKLNKHVKSYGSEIFCTTGVNCSMDVVSHNTIGRIIREIGHRAKAIYSSEETSTGYYTIASIIESLTGKKPISEGNNPRSLIRYWAEGVVTDPNKPAQLVPSTLGTMSHYIHYNWGWGGNCNGYFLIDIFNPENAYEFDYSNGNYSPVDDLSYNLLYKTYSTWR